jgi:signal transduction histidine kinase
VVWVRDHGLGIPADRRARIFERYYRAHAGTPHDYGGLGVGLDLSREIVARHGGRIWFESEEGHGSTFSFSLPLAPEERAS